MNKRNMDICSILVLFLYYFGKVSAFDSKNAQTDSGVYYLEPEEIVYVESESIHIGFFTKKLRIYCYRGQAKSLARIFQTVQLNLDIKNDDFTQYEGTTPEIVRENYETQTSIFSYIWTNKKIEI